MNLPLENLTQLLTAPHPVMLAKIDGFWIFLGIMVLSAISNWFKNRNQPAEVSDESTVPPPIPPRANYGNCPQGHGPLRMWQGHARCWKCGYEANVAASTPATAEQPAAKTVDWEEEMRRILGGEAAPSTPAPPPIIVPAARPVPPPLPPVHDHPPLVPELRRGEEGSFDRDEDVHGKMSNLEAASQAFLRGHQTPEKVAAQMRDVEQMASSSAAYARGQTLPSQVHGRMQQVDQRIDSSRATAPVKRVRGPSTTGLGVAEMLRQPATMRQAMVASLILGPPKCAE